MSVECARCSANNKSGGRCSRNTCKYASMCWQHTKSLRGLQIKESKIPESGSGLFALRPFRKDEELARFGGVLKNEEDDMNRFYTVELKGGVFLDHSSTQAGLARWANDCRNANKIAKQCKGPNARIAVMRQRNDARLVAIKNIAAGEEIYVKYGRGYWS